MILFYFATAPERGTFTLLSNYTLPDGRRVIRYARRDGSKGITLAAFVVLIIKE